MARFTGKSVIVTGGASGIGLATCIRFANEGASVLLCDINAGQAESAAKKIKESGGIAVPHAVDVKDEQACAGMVDAAISAFGKLDIAFNNAGVTNEPQPSFEDADDNDWRRVMDVNLTGIYNCMKPEVAAMKKSGGGVIVNTASIAGLITGPGMTSYVASKHGVVGLTKSAAVDLISSGIRVNAVCPGFIRTPLIAHALEQPGVEEAFAGTVPIKRLAEPEEIAGAVLFLASDDASYVVGEMLCVDGGVTIQ